MFCFLVMDFHCVSWPALSHGAQPPIHSTQLKIPRSTWCLRWLNLFPDHRRVSFFPTNFHAHNNAIPRYAVWKKITFTKTSANPFKPKLTMPFCLVAWSFSFVRFTMRRWQPALRPGWTNVFWLMDLPVLVCLMVYFFSTSGYLSAAHNQI